VTVSVGLSYVLSSFDTRTERLTVAELYNVSVGITERASITDREWKLFWCPGQDTCHLTSVGDFVYLRLGADGKPEVGEVRVSLLMS